MEKNGGDADPDADEDDSCVYTMLVRMMPYLIFVIFLHRQNVWKIKFTLKFTQ